LFLIKAKLGVHIPTLTYGAESLPLTTKHENRIIATEVGFLEE
jgi:hypothetical protein